MKRVWMLAAAAAAAVFVLAPVGVTAQGARFSVASLAPEGSLWDVELRQLGAEWSKLSGNTVRLQPYPGGRLGSEPQIISLLRAGARPEAAALTTGLSEIDRGFAVFGLPFFFESLDEVSAVIDALEPTLKGKLEAQGMTLLAWGFGGWVHVFSTSEIKTIDDLKKAKLFTSAGDSLAENWYRRNGFNPVALATTDVVVALGNGSINAMPAPPYAALVFQWYKNTPYMLDMQVAPLVGAVVVNTKAWSRVPADLQPKLIAAAEAMGDRLKVRIPAQDADAVKEMQSRGLKLTQPAAGFRESAEPLLQSMRGAWVPDDVYDLALKARTAFRQAKSQ